MIKDKNLIPFVFGLCPLIPASSNFAYGIVLSVCVWILFFGGLVSSTVSRFMNIKKSEKQITAVLIVFVTAFLNFLFQGLFPIIQGAIQNYIYILGISYIIYICIDDYQKNSEEIEIPVFYSVLILIFGFLREVFAFGSISFPIPSGFFTLKLPFFYENPPLRFLGTNAGALIFLGFCSWFYISVKQGKILSFKRSE